MVKDWLQTGMLRFHDDRAQMAETIVKELGDHALTLYHNRHLSADKCKEVGLTVEYLEDDTFRIEGTDKVMRGIDAPSGFWECNGPQERGK